MITIFGRKYTKGRNESVKKFIWFFIFVIKIRQKYWLYMWTYILSNSDSILSAFDILVIVIGSSERILFKLSFILVYLVLLMLCFGSRVYILQEYTENHKRSGKNLKTDASGKFLQGSIIIQFCSKASPQKMDVNQEKTTWNLKKILW